MGMLGTTQILTAMKHIKRWHYAVVLLGLIILCHSCRNDEGDGEFETLTPAETEQQQ
jgi:hypothetical protein